MFEANIMLYAWKAYCLLAKVYYDAVAFETAMEFLDKAEAIVKDHYPPHSQEYLDMKKEIACYYKRF